MTNKYLTQLKNHLLWSGLSDDEIYDILSDAVSYIKTAKDNCKSEKEIISDLGTPKEFASSVKATTIERKRKFNIRKLYMLTAVIWIMILIVYTLNTFSHTDSSKYLPSIVPISLLLCLWFISGNFYLINVINIQKINVWCILQSVIFIFSSILMYFIYSGVDKYLHILAEKNMLDRFAPVFNGGVTVCVLIILAVILYSFVTCCFRGELLNFGILCQGIGLLYTVMLYRNAIYNSVGLEMQHLSFSPKMYYICLAAGIFSYIHIFINNGKCYGRTD